MQKAVNLGPLIHFLDIEDPRKNIHLIKHNVFEIIAITILATLSAAENWAEIEEWAENNADWLDTFLDLPNGIPSHDTFSRVFAKLDPKSLQNALIEWTQELAHIVPGVIAIDGKTVRRSKDVAENISPIHLLSAYSAEMKLCLAQLRVDSKSNEITAIPELLKLLNLKQAVVTIDAIGCQKDIATLIRERKGHYVFCLKENHPTALREAQEYLTPTMQEAALLKEKTIEKDHGRVEKRAMSGRKLVEGLPALLDFTGAQSVWKIERETLVQGTGERRKQESYYLSSLPANTNEDARKMLETVRTHWEIENSVHWVLDVAMNEDQNRSRQGYNAENLALVRKVALNVIRQDTGRKRGIKASMKKAGWNREYLLYLLGLV